MRPGVARDALRTASLTSAYSRRTGCDLDEAAEVVEHGLTRRRLLQGAGVAAVAATLPGAMAGSAAASPAGKSQPKVVVIGAGAAGLGCAYRLWRKYGVRAEIYEYADHVGGRIRTLRGHFDDGQLVEEHAEFINPEPGLRRQTLVTAGAQPRLAPLRLEAVPRRRGQPRAVPDAAQPQHRARPALGPDVRRGLDRRPGAGWDRR
jgi:NADPH-dependent 2,4-dienoyl-CoA reductase/sulfur reductase-like enzyme